MISRAIKILSPGFVAILSVTGISQFAAAQTKIPLVDIRSVDRTIAIELRYGGPHNITGHALYPPGTLALVRPEVAKRLAVAQAYLRSNKYGLKIWDAYRPKSVQVQLWQASSMNDFVADPETPNGSLHSWGIAVDATLVDSRKRSVRMPTDFDDFSPAAMWTYQGDDPLIRSHLFILQTAMRKAGFYGMRAEWWHFTVSDWQKYVPDPALTFTAQPPPQKSQHKL
jgi:D-alanyl-D-alanine dipeptidase